MNRFLLLVICLFLFYISSPLIGKQIENTEYHKTLDHIQSEIKVVKDNPEVLAIINSFSNEIQHWIKQLDLLVETSPLTKRNTDPKQSEEVQLKTPTKQLFSIYNVELGDAKEDIEQNLGAAKRFSLNEYGTNWYTYHENYHGFMMVMYDEDNKAIGLYTNQDVISSTNGIKLGSTKEKLRETLGEPISEIQKGFMIYQLNKNSDYDMYLLDGAYVTIFYDKHEGETVTAMQIINQDLEQRKTEFYTKDSPSLKEGFEFQLFDLTNATRVNHQLSILSWDQHVKETARKHSADMALNQYFDHTNLKGQSPFDRMKEDNVFFHMAGENLATGQFSSIFAHEGLMNSLGHRENILREGYEYLGVGVAFNDKSQPYYTENFYAK